jgi:hypothetical protein
LREKEDCDGAVSDLSFDSTGRQRDLHRLPIPHRLFEFSGKFFSLSVRHGSYGQCCKNENEGDTRTSEVDNDFRGSIVLFKSDLVLVERRMESCRVVERKE